MAIVAAVDRSERAANVVREAEALAEAFDDTVHVIHVLTRDEFVRLGRSQPENKEMIDIETVRETAAEIASERATDLTVPWEAVGLIGEPENVITQYAADEDARYIVVGPRKRSPAGKAIFGSVAQSILLEADQPVVTAVSS